MVGKKVFHCVRWLAKGRGAIMQYSVGTQVKVFNALSVFPISYSGWKYSNPNRASSSWSSTTLSDPKCSKRSLSENFVWAAGLSKKMLSLSSMLWRWLIKNSNHMQSPQVLGWLDRFDCCSPVSSAQYNGPKSPTVID